MCGFGRNIRSDGFVEKCLYCDDPEFDAMRLAVGENYLDCDPPDQDQGTAGYYD